MATREFREVSRFDETAPAEPALRIRVGTTTLDPADAPDGYGGALRRARLQAELLARDGTPTAIEEERDWPEEVARP